MDRKNRIAFYGGTFDPVHLGHLAVATSVLELFEIDELFFVPAQLAPHKVSHDVTPALHRCAMLTLATQDSERLLVSTFEIEAPERCYTVDTLAHFKADLADTADIFFVMGADSWSEVTTWRQWERLVTMVNHIVVTRPGYDLSVKDVAPALTSQIVDLRGAASTKGAGIALDREHARVFFTDAVTMDVSATDIRAAARESDREQLRKLVPLAVANYITKYGLYKDQNER